MVYCKTPGSEPDEKRQEKSHINPYPIPSRKAGGAPAEAAAEAADNRGLEGDVLSNNQAEEVGGSWIPAGEGGEEVLPSLQRDPAGRAVH